MDGYASSARVTPAAGYTPSDSPAGTVRAPARADERLRTGLIGAGSFGAYHANKLASLMRSRFIGIHDPDSARASALAAQHDARPFGQLEALLAACDAVIIASPGSTHAAIAGAALEAGVHVLVEKPLATTAEDADWLVTLARRQGLVLQTGHQERFVMQALGLLDAPQAPSRIVAARESTPSGRGLDVSVTMDLMIHDLDLVASLFGASPLKIEARGEGPAGRYDTVDATLTFAAGEARLRASRVATERRRLMQIAYPAGVAEIDFAARTVIAPPALGLDPDFAAKASDPLGMSVAAFLDACAGRGAAGAPGEAGAAAVRLASAIDACCALAR